MTRRSLITQNSNLVTEPTVNRVMNSVANLASEVVPPSAEMRDLFGAGEAVRFADESRHPLTALEPNAADGERRRYRRDEATESIFRNGPDFDLDSWTFVIRLARQARLGWHCVRQCEQAIVLRCAACSNQPRPAVGQLRVERLPGQVRADHRHRDAAWRIMHGRRVAGEEPIA